MDTGHTPRLFLAALRGEIDTVRAELAAGVSPDIPCTGDDLGGHTPLMGALFHEGVDTARVLLAAGASITPAVASEFAHACGFHFNGSRTDAMLQLLLEYGLDPNITFGWGNTLLISLASTPQCRNCVRMLLEHGAKVNSCNGRHDTAFSVAARAGEEETLRLLLQHGADANARNEYGHTALMQIILNGVSCEDWSMLTDEEGELRYYESINGAPRDTEEMLPCLRALLPCGVDLNLRAESGWNALLFCLAIGQAEAARLLIAHGATLEGLAESCIHRARCCMELHGFADALRLLDEQHNPDGQPALAPIPTRRRDFFIRRDQHRGTAYINLQCGSFDHEFSWASFSWEEQGDAPCISDDDIYTSGLAYVLEEVIPDYSPYEAYNISREQWNAILASAQRKGGKPAHAVEEIRAWVEACFASGEGFCILGV